MARTAAKTSKQGGDPAAPAVSTGPQKYLDRALVVLQRFGVAPRPDLGHELIRLLDEVKSVDEPRVLAIANTVKYMSDFNRLVRDNVEAIDVGDRYLEIAGAFDSVREDSKTLVNQLADGRIGPMERAQNLWMRLRRGTPAARFETIADLYRDVAADTKDQLDREDAILDGYIDFRFALKEAEIAARELFEGFKPRLDAAGAGLADAQAAIDAAGEADDAARSRLELARDEARAAFEDADRTYQLLKDIAEDLAIGYDVGETLIAKLKQTHDVKERVYRRSVTFFTTNEHVITVLGTVYTAQHGLHEATQSHEAMKEGINKGLEDVADLGRELEHAAIKAGYGSTIRPESVEKLVRAISDYQVESMELVAELRRESEANATAIRRVVEEGKRRYQETLARNAISGRSVAEALTGPSRAEEG